MSEIVSVSPIFTTTTSENCSNGVDISVTVSNLTVNTTYWIVLRLLASDTSVDLNPPVFLNTGDIDPFTRETWVPLGPYTIAKRIRLSTLTSYTYTFTGRFQGSRYFILGAELRRGTLLQGSSITSPAEGNSLTIDCSALTPLLTPTVTPSSVANINVFNLDRIIEKGEILYELVNDDFTRDEIEAYTDLDENNRFYIREPHQDLIKVVEIIDNKSVVVDYLIVPSGTPRPTVTPTNTSTPTNTPTNTQTPTTTPTILPQEQPFLLSFDVANSLLTVSVSLEWFENLNTNNNINQITINFNSDIILNSDAMSSTIGGSSPSGTSNWIKANGPNIVSIINASPATILYNEENKLEFVLKYDSITSSDNVKITGIEILDSNGDPFVLKTALVKHQPNINDIVDIYINMFNISNASTNDNISVIQINFQNETINIPDSGFASTYPAIISDFIIKSASGTSAAFVDATKFFKYDSNGYFRISVKDGRSLADRTGNNGLPIVSEIILSDTDGASFTPPGIIIQQFEAMANPPSAPTGPKYYYGDVASPYNGSINASDALLVLKAAVNSENLFFNADNTWKSNIPDLFKILANIRTRPRLASNAGKPTASDALEVLKYAVRSSSNPKYDLSIPSNLAALEYSIDSGITQTPTPSVSLTPSISLTPTNSSTPQNTPTNTPTQTATPPNTPTNTITPTYTPTHSITPSVTPTYTPTPTGRLINFLINNDDKLIYSLSNDLPNLFDINILSYDTVINCPGETLLSLAINNLAIGNTHEYSFELHGSLYAQNITLDPSIGLTRFIATDASRSFSTIIRYDNTTDIFVIRFYIRDLTVDKSQTQNFIYRCSGI